MGGSIAALELMGNQGRSTESSRHPHIFITREMENGLRSIAGVKSSIQQGISRDIWKRIREECDAERGVPALTARSLFEGRYEAAARQNNPDYTVCKAAGQRILRNALAMLITEDEIYREIALRQMWALLDESVWPDWIDQAHLRFGHPADLRTGMLSQDVGIAFDWLYPYLSQAEREQIIDGLDRRGIQPFLTSMAQDPWWAHDLNNWYTVIIGGLGIAGMAVGDAHPRSKDLVDLSLSKMQAYLSIYGRGGEFNESVAYSNATRIPVAYFQAYYYHRSGGENFLAKRPFPQTGEWTIYSTLPPGRYAAFGDGWVGAAPEVEFMTAIASASRHPVLQEFCMRHLKASSNPFLLLWHDPSVPQSDPAGRLPLGRAYRDNGAQVFSRSDWDAEKATMIVYGKAKRDHNHAHNDVGQVCIDTMGQRMIVDLGSPSAYPPDFFDENRWRYYNASTLGHNVPMFGGREQRSPSHKRGVKSEIDFSALSGRFLQTKFDDQIGGYWQLDLSAAYDGVKSVKRTVVHLLPGIAVVLDEGELEKVEEISLRWHTIEAANPTASGSFRVESAGASLACQVVVYDGKLRSHKLMRHRYEPPFDKDRSGDLLEQRREPYVDTRIDGYRYRALSLFASDPSANASWKERDGAWAIECQEGRIRVRLDERTLSVDNESLLRTLRVSLQT